MPKKPPPQSLRIPLPGNSRRSWTGKQNRNGFSSYIQMVEGMFLFAMIWSVGCTTDAAGRKVFDAFFR